MRIDNVEMWIDPQRGGEEPAPVGGITIEEIAVVEIAIGARIGHRLGGLVDRIFVSAAENH